MTTFRLSGAAGWVRPPTPAFTRVKLIRVTRLSAGKAKGTTVASRAKRGLHFFKGDEGAEEYTENS